MAEKGYDVVVIGAGSAAYEAAVAARQAGAERIVMLEKAAEADSGGNARFSHTGFRFVFSGPEEIRAFVPDTDEGFFRTLHIPPYTREDFLSDLERVTRGRIDRTLAEYMVDSSNGALHWMRETGIRWEPEKSVLVDGKRYFEPGIVLHPKGGGRGQIAQWRAIAEGLGIEIRFGSRVSGFLGDDRAVEGVRVSTRDSAYDLEGKAVIACSGGFQANIEMRARYLGPNADLVKVRGSRHNTGEVLRMMLDLGAKPAGHWQGAHATPIDAAAPDVETPLREDGRGNTMNRYDYMYGITVNTLGERFYDEGEARHSYTYAKTGRAVLAQPGGIAYQIFDRKGISLFRHGPDYPATHEEAETIATLAAKIGLAPEVLGRTVEQFNAAVRDEVPFDPRRLDGRCTEGLTPRKSNWAVRIDEPPFRAYPITCGITFTFGGVAIDTGAHVLNSADEPIRGLYASGDVVGLFFHNYPSCTGQTRNAVFSRTAARNAVVGN
ncbi:MAG TPA: FAD-dependent tricarballylate dehydrogenase TcuA [Alphaproteobacteria bacterium]|jgi:tricarballylate dehydrogenase